MPAVQVAEQLRHALKAAGFALPSGGERESDPLEVFRTVAAIGPEAAATAQQLLSPETGKLEFGGWVWRYDLTQLGPDETKVTLSYDWSAVGPVPRQHIQFPPFTPDHLDNSLSHLAAIVAR